MVCQIRNDYEQIQSWYTDAMISRIYPLVESGEFGSQEDLANLLEDDQIFRRPSVFVSIWITSLAPDLIICIAGP